MFELKATALVRSRTEPSLYSPTATSCSLRSHADHAPVRWIDRERTEPCLPGRIIRSAFLQPIQNQVVVIGTDFEALPAAMRFLEGRLAKHQAVGGVRSVDASALGVSGDGVIVHVGVAAEERQLEAFLTANGSMAIGVGAIGAA